VKARPRVAGSLESVSMTKLQISAKQRLTFAKYNVFNTKASAFGFARSES
jgi:hypothetical protein